MQKILTHYLKDVYVLENITEKNIDSPISVEESLFIHENGVQVWV